MVLSRSLSSSWSKKATAAVTESVHTSEMLRPVTVTPSDSGFSRAPLQAGQGFSDMYFSSSCFKKSDSVSSYRRWRLARTPSKGASYQRLWPYWLR